MVQNRGAALTYESFPVLEYHAGNACDAALFSRGIQVFLKDVAIGGLDRCPQAGSDAARGLVVFLDRADDALLDPEWVREAPNGLDQHIHAATPTLGGYEGRVLQYAQVAGLFLPHTVLDADGIH
jgi:hypothetical protein